MASASSSAAAAAAAACRLTDEEEREVAVVMRLTTEEHLADVADRRADEEMKFRVRMAEREDALETFEETPPVLRPPSMSFSEHIVFQNVMARRNTATAQSSAIEGMFKSRLTSRTVTVVTQSGVTYRSIVAPTVVVDTKPSTIPASKKANTSKAIKEHGRPIVEYRGRERTHKLFWIVEDIIRPLAKKNVFSPQTNDAPVVWMIVDYAASWCERHGLPVTGPYFVSLGGCHARKEETVVQTNGTEHDIVVKSKSIRCNQSLCDSELCVVGVRKDACERDQERHGLGGDRLCDHYTDFCVAHARHNDTVGFLSRAYKCMLCTHVYPYCQTSNIPGESIVFCRPRASGFKTQPMTTNHKTFEPGSDSEEDSDAETENDSDTGEAKPKPRKKRTPKKLLSTVVYCSFICGSCFRDPMRRSLEAITHILHHIQPTYHEVYTTLGLRVAQMMREKDPARRWIGNFIKDEFLANAGCFVTHLPVDPEFPSFTSQTVSDAASLVRNFNLVADPSNKKRKEEVGPIVEWLRQVKYKTHIKAFGEHTKSFGLESAGVHQAVSAWHASAAARAPLRPNIKLVKVRRPPAASASLAASRRIAYEEAQNFTASSAAAAAAKPTSVIAASK